MVGAETLTRIIDWNDRGTSVLFGDGAGAVILQPADEPGIISTRLHSDGKYKDLLLYPDGVSKGFKLVREGKAQRADEGQRSLQSGGQYLGAAGHRDPERQQYLQGSSLIG